MEETKDYVYRCLNCEYRFTAKRDTMNQCPRCTQANLDLVFVRVTTR